MITLKADRSLLHEPSRADLEDAIALVRAELGAYAHIQGAVWQAMRDSWAAMVRKHRALYGRPVAMQGSGPIAMPPYWPGPLIA